ncbi:MAG: DMT family transporter [bacterium]
MTFLLLAVFFATANTVVANFAEMRKLDRLALVGSNYVIASALTCAGWAWSGSPPPSPLTVGLGAVGGVFFAGTLFLWMGAVARTGMAISTAAWRMSVIWPVLLSIAVFGEIPGVWQIAGIGLALAAVFLIALGGAPRSQPGRAAGFSRGFWRSGTAWLLATFVVAGGTGTTLKIFTELGAPGERQALLAVIFLSAGFLCWVPLLLRRVAPTRAELALGTIFGVNNAVGNFFLLRGLQIVPGVVAFPLVNAGILVAATGLGVLIWRERPGRAGWAALALSLGAIGLMRL